VNALLAAEGRFQQTRQGGTVHRHKRLHCDDYTGAGFAPQFLANAAFPVIKTVASVAALPNMFAQLYELGFPTSPHHWSASPLSS
jgi:hypothetical protein